MKRANVASLVAFCGFFVMVLMVSVSWAGPAARKAGMHLYPTPSYQPGQVIQLQLQALRFNDVPAPNNGIAITFRFASPGNKRYTGPLNRFITMLYAPAYRPMLNHKRASVGRVVVRGNKAQAIVVLQSSKGKRMGYLWVLGKETSGKHKGCWMTQSVIPVKLPNPTA